jgi:hypothetical protein
LYPKTLWNIADIITKNYLSASFMECVSESLAKSANVKLTAQRLDRVHVSSGMAKLPMVALLRKNVVVFLKRLKKNHKK